MIIQSQKTNIGSPKHVLQSMRASSSLELAETSMAKNLQKKSSNGLDNSANGFRTSKNP
jgi:hypothetical protein